LFVDPPRQRLFIELYQLADILIDQRTDSEPRTGIDLPDLAALEPGKNLLYSRQFAGDTETTTVDAPSPKSARAD